MREMFHEAFGTRILAGMTKAEVFPLPTTRLIQQPRIRVDRLTIGLSGRLNLVETPEHQPDNLNP